MTLFTVESADMDHGFRFVIWFLAKITLDKWWNCGTERPGVHTFQLITGNSDMALFIEIRSPWIVWIWTMAYVHTFNNRILSDSYPGSYYKCGGTEPQL